MADAVPNSSSPLPLFNDVFKAIDSSGLNMVERATVIAKVLFSRGYIPLALDGKVPRWKNWSKVGRADCMQKFMTLIGMMEKPGVGILCGRDAGIFVLDVDSYKGEEVEKGLFGTNEPPRTQVIKTGKGGRHFFFLWEERLGMFKSTKEAWLHHGIPHVDVRTDGGQIVAPGCIHVETGVMYSVEVDFPLIRMPDWLFEHLKCAELKRLHHERLEVPKSASERKDDSTVVDLESEDPSVWYQRKLLSPKACRAFIGLLKPSRSVSYDTWLEVIFVVHNVCNDAEEGLKIAHEWSMLCPEKYKEAEVVQKWNSCRSVGCRFGYNRLLTLIGVDSGHKACAKFKRKFKS